MPCRCAATPDALTAVGRSGPDREARLVAAGSRLLDAAELLAATGGPGAPALRGLGEAVARRARAGAAVDRWVASVGAAFARLEATPPSSIVFGDLDHAAHVAVFVPGMGASSDGGVAAALKRARQLFEAAAELDPATAVVAWFGYDAPGPFDVLLDDAAVTGGDELADLVAALPRSAVRDVTVVAHSYGTIVATEALRSGMHVDDVVFAGSPGVPAATVADLGAGGADVYAERAPFDVVATSEAFGRDPSDPRFGATRLATGPGVTGHSAYFDDSTTALANLAAVVVQRDDLLVRVAPSAAERAVGRVDDVWAAVVEAPTDNAQRAVADVNAALDALERWGAPWMWDGVVEPERHLRGALVEEANRLIDVAQRVASPDGAADLFGDAWALISGASE